MKRLLIALFFITGLLSGACAQRPAWGKMSPWLRQKVRTELPRPVAESRAAVPQKERQLLALVRLDSKDGEAVLSRYRCRSLLQIGNCHLASIPVGQLAALSNDRRVLRMESKPLNSITTDSMAHHVNALPAYEGTNLPQAFTGEGVVMGITDIGFDLTHPTFYNRDATEYRIKRLWDFLSTDTIGSRLYVGRDYTTREELLSLGHTVDGKAQSHGTHTLGTAAGSGYNTPYRGIAPSSDLCIVANLVSNNAEQADSAIYAKIDADVFIDLLAYKYIFDYADSVGKPCVISFSEGSTMDCWGGDAIFEDMLRGMVGPGHILVSSAGNTAYKKTWFRKERGEASKGAFIVNYSDYYLYGVLRSPDDFTLRLVSYAAKNDTLLIHNRQIFDEPDSTLRITGGFGGTDSLIIAAYASCYNPKDIGYDFILYGTNVGDHPHLSLELMGKEAEVEYWNLYGYLWGSTENPALTAGENTHNILSPGCLPSVICVGATNYRDSILNLKGEWKKGWISPRGTRAVFSAVGPTMDGRIKPDVVAPGNNIIASYNSFFFEDKPESSEFNWNVALTEFNGRTYPWTSDAGTSMSTPAVAGVIALWLQAKPDLTPNEAMDVIAHTSRRPDPSLTYPNNEYGYGEIDAYRGLLYLLGIDQIKDVSTNHTRASVNITDRQLCVTLPQPSDKRTSLRLYDLKGRLIMSEALPKNQQSLSVPVNTLSRGVYVVQIDGEQSVSGSTLIRF